MYMWSLQTPILTVMQKILHCSNHHRLKILLYSHLCLKTPSHHQLHWHWEISAWKSGKTPITKRKQRTRKYGKKKLDEVTSMMEKLVIGEDSNSDDSEIIGSSRRNFDWRVKEASEYKYWRYYRRVGQLEKLKQGLVCRISWPGLPRS